MTDGDGVDTPGTGPATVLDVPSGDITLTWGALAGYATPTTNPETLALTSGGLVTFSGVYQLAAPDEPVAIHPLPGAYDLPTTITFRWEATTGALTHDIYIWQVGDAKPTTPTAANLTGTEYGPVAGFHRAARYIWMLVARNNIGETPGPEWPFQTVHSNASSIALWRKY